MKFLAARQDLDKNPTRLYENIKTDHFFANENSKEVAFITPFCIFTDTSDILIWTDHDIVHVGLHFYIKKPTIVYRKANFNDTIESSIRDYYDNLFQGCDIVETDVQIIDTNRAIYNLDRNQIYPIFFVIFPYNRPIRIFKNELPQALPVSAKSCIKQGLPGNTVNLISMSVIYLIKMGEILFPLPDESIELYGQAD